VWRETRLVVTVSRRLAFGISVLQPPLFSNSNLTKQKQGDTMNKIKSTLFLAIFIAITATTTLAADGQIPIGGRTASEIDKTTTATIITATEPNNETPFEISDYLWTFASIVGQLKF